MNANSSPKQKFNRVLMSILSLLAILVIVFPVIQIGFAVSSSPFLGPWQSVDGDGNEMSLTISGAAEGLFQITWTGADLSPCANTASIVYGTGQLHKSEPHRLEADLYLNCLTGETSSDVHFLWRYHPLTNTLSGRDDDGVLTTWRRADRPSTSLPVLNLRVNYGDNWVESFYEAGRMAWITVTESDGVIIKATAELTTEPKNYWGGASGFQTIDTVWFDAKGNQMGNPPDIRPDDWVFGWVDNGASAQVQIGDIRGVVNLAADSIEGTILVPWMTDPLPVTCLDWGSGGNAFLNVDKDGGLLSTNGIQTYHCSWAGEWNIESGQTVGVGYTGSDGNWVANAFFAADPTFNAYFPGAIEGYDWPMGSTVTVTINGEYTAQAISEPRPAAPSGRTRVLFELSRNNFVLKPGDHIVMTDGSTTKDSVVTPLAVTDFDVNTRTVSGTYDPDSNLRVWLYDREGQITATDPEIGTWVASFDQLQSGALGGASQQDVDGDGTSIDFEVPQTFLVSSTEDVIGNDGVCTLREAVIAANTNAPSGPMSGECPAGMNRATDIILLAANQTYSLTIGSTHEDSAANGDLDIWDNPAATDLSIMVQGNGKATISQDASVDDRVLENRGATVKIKGLILTGGSHVGNGGGVLNNGMLDMSASEIVNNVVDWSGGGIFNTNSAELTLTSSTISNNSVPNNGGGGIMNEGLLKLTDSMIFNNTAKHDGGGIANIGTLIMDASRVFANSGQGGGGVANWPGGTVLIQNGSVIGGDPSAGEGNTGGGILNYNVLAVESSTITGNSANYAGGISNWGGQVTLGNSTVSNNSASVSGGGIHNKDGGSVTIEDGSVITDNIAPSSAGIENWENSTVTISNSKVSSNVATTYNGGGIANWATLAVDGSVISNNSASGTEYSSGGGIANLGGTVTFTNSTISENMSAWGGGIFTQGGKLTLDASRVSGNRASSDAGGVFIKESAVVNIQNASLISENTASYGSGIANWSGTLTVDASSIVDNTAANSGGGILNKDRGATIIQNASIVSGNTADWGGGISNWDGILSITNSTVSGNTANGGGGGMTNGGTLTITTSKILNNTSPGEGDAVYSTTNIVNATSVTASCISGNENTAVFNERPASQNFIGNWWGSRSGPAHRTNPGGLGDSVSDFVDFLAWLTEPPSICAP